MLFIFSLISSLLRSGYSNKRSSKKISLMADVKINPGTDEGSFQLNKRVPELCYKKVISFEMTFFEGKENHSPKHRFK